MGIGIVEPNRNDAVARDGSPACGITIELESRLELTLDLMSVPSAARQTTSTIPIANANVIASFKLIIPHY